MERPHSEKKTMHAEVARLGQELEQARVALEDAQAEIVGLIEEREQLRHNVARLDQARSNAEQTLL